MNEEITITGSIVLFDENLTDLHKAIECFLNIPFKKKLYLIDNTPSRFFEYVFVDKQIEYIAIEENIGFGSAHNKILNKLKNTSNFHLVLNPDVSFKPSIISPLIKELEKDRNIAMVAPKVLFPDGRHQYSCRRYPSVSELLARRFTFLKPMFKSIILKGEYRERDLNSPFFAEYITGCFQLYKTENLLQLKGFDERYFLYMEDVDICKKIDEIGKKKLYYPKEEIVHVLKQGSSKDIKLFFRHTSSAFKYFLKWGL
ncbi:glycosyl transferase family 2 [Polaribacter sp. MSW13]|uniref:Glycosyl transferase family 2 n=1 Tax=Polaribacter marinus TaxID=2916838 RepID=A0A9X1VQ44_9FLAO|nr:glycosyltransferase [Polaribacter marinus]MCI2228625.1 glycosyl transferase family 2 [Polaribacter marinus]